MTSIALSNSPRQTFITLWTRAPLWRFVAMSAALLTLLFILFPPQSSIKKTKPFTANGSASYEPMVTTEKNAASSTQPNDIANQTDSAASTSSSVNTTHTASPKTANLTLATANPQTGKTNTTGVDEALLGRSYSDSLHVGNFTLALPPGNWSMLANTSINTPTASGMAYFLGRIEQRRLIAALKIFAVTSKDQPGNGFEVTHCSVNNSNAISIHEEGLTPYGHQACWSISNMYTPPWQQWADKANKIPTLDRAAAGDMAAKGVSYSQDYVLITYTRAEKWGLLEVSQLIDPEHDGIKSTVAPSYFDSDWQKANIVKHPEKVAYVEGLKDSANVYWRKIDLAFEAADPHLPELPEVPVPIPPPSHFAALENVDAVPYIDQDGREQYRQFLSKPKPRVFLISDKGGTGTFLGGTNPLGRGLNGCKEHGVQCYPYAIDDNVVWVKPSTVTTPPPSHFAALDDIKAVPYINDKNRQQYQEFLAKPLPRAFLIMTDGGCASTVGGIDPLGRGLRLCKQRGIECQPYAVDNDVVWVAPKSSN